MTHEPKCADDAEEILNRAAVLYQANRLTEAAGLYSRINVAAPEHVAARYQLAMIDLKLGHFEKAVDGFRYVVAQDPDSFVAYYNLGFTYQQLGRWQLAYEAYERASALQPSDIPTLFGLAAAFAFLGRLNDAVACYRTLISIPSVRLRALVRLAILDPAAITTDELATMKHATRVALNIEQDIELHFALGEALERRQQFDAAFDAFASGNRRKRDSLVGTSNPNSVARQHQDLINGIRRQFDAGFIARHAHAGNNSTAPIFIVGMPRSGSTLIEQILSSHPDIQGFGEYPTLPKVIGRAYPYDPKAPRLIDHFASLGDQYLDEMKSLGWRHTPRFVDKMLDNYLHVGMIHLMFPNAIILHSVRNAIDTCFACFRQLFTGAGNESTYDLRDIAGEYLRYREMMAHWQTVLPERVIAIEYEALVNDPESQIQRLVTDVCGLEWNDACLDFHNSSQPVRTASSSQVRKPIFSSSAQRWRRYENHLAPLIHALGPFVDDVRAEPNS